MWMFFNSIEEKDRFRKEINRLLSKGMTNIYLKVIIEGKNWCSQNFDFSGFKRFVTRSVLGSSNSRRYHWIGSKIVLLFYYFNFERNYGVLETKSPYIFLNKNINFIKNETESKIENPSHSLTETNLVLQLI